MNIDRNNYETFFLLYIDNELSAADRKTVETFVAQHTDLHEELAQLQAVVLPDEVLPYDNKMGLHKTLLTDETTEQLMLHLDNELTAAESKKTDAMIAADATLQAEWAVLQHIKLDASDHILFKYKSLLYRREKDNVIAGRFVRWAIAAALLGFGFFAVVTMYNRKAADNSTIAVNGATEQKNIIEKIVTKPAAKTYDTTEALAENASSIPQAKKDMAITNKANGQVAKDKTIARSFVTGPQKSIAEKEPAKLQPQDDIAGNTTLPTGIKNQQLQKLPPERNINELAITAAKKRPDITDENILLNKNKNSNAVVASLTEETNNNHILFLSEEDVSHSKAGVFFRKLKRTVERKTKIKTGNNIKIAGFEIALN